MMTAQTQARIKRRQMQSSRVVAEIIGRGRSVYSTQSYRTQTYLSVDRTQPDYAWWSLFARGKQPGYELGGLFAKPIVEIATAWVLGGGFTGKSGNEATDKRLAEFVAEGMETLLAAVKDSLKLGDGYVIINPDGSLSQAAPDCVEIVTSDTDYREVTAYKITTRLEKVTIIDEYRADVRIVTVKVTGRETMILPLQFDYDNPRQPLDPGTAQSVYPNPLGVIPVIHFAQGKEANETHGHPIYEALLKLFARYDNLINKSADGAEVMGRPVPVAYVEDPELAQEQNKTREEEVHDTDGNTRTVPVTDLDDVNMLWLKAGAGVGFEFAAPGSFSADSVALLKKFFYLMLEHIGIPEWVWGGAVQSSKASVDAQLPAFVRLIELWRTTLAKPLSELLRIWLLTVSYFQPVAVAKKITITWPEVTGKDERLLLDKVKYATTEAGSMTKETALRLLDMIPDEQVEAEVAAAKADAEAAQAQFDETVNAKIDAMNTPDTGEEDGDDE